MAKIQGLKLDVLCEALGVERPNEVTRVVVDIRAGNVPMLYVERIGDPDKILAGLTGPEIELRREDVQRPVQGVPGRPGANGPVVHGNVSGANIAWGNGSVVQNGR